ncbi:Cytochrome P450 monooxygenase [Lactarius tabidus]
MKAYISAPPLAFPGYCTAELRGLPDCVWELATTHVGIVVLGFSVIIVTRYLRSPWRCVPPGPWGLPILGNAAKLQDKTWLFGQDCKEKYGDMVYLTALGQPIIVFNSLKAASELLDRRANIYSDRPRLIMGNEILSGGLFSAFLPYGDVWRRTRRAAHEGLTKNAARSYHTLLRKEGILLASALLSSPRARDLEKHFQRTAASATMSMLYDYPTLETENDKTLSEIHAFIDRLSIAAVPGAYLVELFPWMMHIPERFARWKAEGRRDFERSDIMFQTLLNRVRSDVMKDSERPSLSASLIKNCDRRPLSNQEMAWLLGTLYSAGAETTSTTMYWWAFAMVAHPEVQRRAQAELDTVVGRSRIPTFSDVPNLPYIQAMVKETLRWRPVLPFSLPHATTEDDWYNGMFIPKGTTFLTNLWQCHHDPSFYGDDASSFKPERFLDAHGKILPGPAETREEGHSTYGFGRRACVGKHVANDSLFIFIATTLWAANLERVRDKDGKETPLHLNTFVDTGMVFKPALFECKITPRFPEVHLILTAEAEMLKT